MADEDVATKAPESDLHAQEQSAIPASTSTSAPKDTTETTDISQTETATADRAQSGPSMGDHCTTDRPLPANTPAPSGSMLDLNGIPSYISKPTTYPHNPGKLLLLLTNGSGIHSTNNQLQADAFAARGFLVVMPDQFGGDPAPNTAAVAPADLQNVGFLERFKLGAAETAKSFLIDMWLARHTPAKVLPLLDAALAGAREQFADAVANGGGVYGAGYCFGAKYVLLLLGGAADDPATASDSAAPAPAETDEEAGKGKPEPELKAGVIAHGTLVTKDDVERVKKPVAMACVAGDQLFPDEVREQGKAALELNGVEHEVRVFEGVPHGFAVVGEYGDEHIERSQRDAYEMMASWLESH